MSRIFLSHASKDHEIAERVVERLEHCGLSCWIAPRDIPAGTDFQKSLFEALAACDVVLLLVSARSNKSDDIAQELAVARRYRKTVVPARIEDVQPEAALGYQVTNVQWVDLFRDFDANIARLCRDLGKTLQVSEQVAAAQKRLQLRRRIATVGAAVFCICIATGAGGLAWHLLPSPRLTVFAPAQVAVAAPATLPQPVVAPAVVAPAVDPVQAFVAEYYKHVSGPADDVIAYLGSGAAAEPLRFYGKMIDRQQLLSNEERYVRNWPDRNFTPRQGSIGVSCDAAGGDCAVSGIIDYDVRNPATDQARWGAERFNMHVLRMGNGFQITALDGQPVERHSGSATTRASTATASEDVRYAHQP